jgi:NAD(P)-dependent dehydrogenase (short-subunit alcohol dehydrogenase family)
LVGVQDVNGKVAVVTGGGGGIGKALGARFGQAGMKVVLADVLPDPLDAATTALREAGIDVVGHLTDVTSYESVCALRDAALDAFGAVHVLCNNAGVGSGGLGHIWEHHLVDWRWSYDVMVFGVINGLNAFVPTMLAQDTEGHVVNTTSSNGGFTPLMTSGAYASSKAAITTITECLWGQLRAMGAKVSASLLFPSTRTPGVLDTGLWKAGANRPERYSRGPDDPEPPEGRDALADYKRIMAEKGLPVQYAPLEEVADLCLDGILSDTFWITVPSERQHDLIRRRAQSQIDQQPPMYLLADTDMPGPPPQKEDAKEDAHD